jgi:hypothetical protein
MQKFKKLIAKQLMFIVVSYGPFVESMTKKQREDFEDIQLCANILKNHMIDIKNVPPRIKLMDHEFN